MTSNPASSSPEVSSITACRAPTIFRCFLSELVEIPAKTNPLGIKGIGEAGTIAAPPTVVNAVLDALRTRGVEHLDMPLTPARIWQAANAPAKERA